MTLRTDFTAVAELLRERFPLDQSMSVQDASQWALVELGVEDSLAFALSTEDFGLKVLGMLRRLPADSLPFTFSQLEDGRLVGKRRSIRGDTAEVTRARARLAALPLLEKAVFEAGPCGFEKISAGVMRLFGASDSVAMCTGDEGGIDVYGRVPLRLSDPLVAHNLIPRALVDRKLLFLGQCKCIRPDRDLDPSVIRDFKAAVSDCLNKYEHNRRPPSHRVPSEYYKRQETCLKFIFTTGQVSDKAAAAAEADDIAFLNGRSIAALLIANGIGSDVDNNFDSAGFSRWVGLP